RVAIQPFNAQMEVLANGAKVVSLLGSGSAKDQAVSAAQCALAMCAVEGVDPMALVTGRAVVSERLPIGEVIDRGVEVLRNAEAGNVRIDGVTAGLLDARFDVGSDGAGTYLRGERDIAAGPR